MPGRSSAACAAACPAGVRVGTVAVHVQDMYVDFNLSLETAAQIKGLRMWTTNEYQHSGIRDDGAVILERLLSMARGTLVNF